MSDKDLDVLPDLDEDSSLYHKDLPLLKQMRIFKNDKALMEENGDTNFEEEVSFFLEPGTVELGEAGELELVLGAGKREREGDESDEKGNKRTRVSESQEETEVGGEGDSESSSSTIILAEQSPLALVDSFPDLDALDAGSTGEEGIYSTGEEGSQETVRESEPDLVVYSERTSSEADPMAGSGDTLLC